MVDLQTNDRRAYAALCALANESAVALGEKAYADGTRWIAHTPERAPEAYLHQFYGPLSPNEIKDLEDELGGVFPASFSNFLELHNGIGLFANYINIYGLQRRRTRTDMTVAAQQPFSIFTPNGNERPKTAPDSLIFVGSIGDERNLLAALQDGRLLIWNEARSTDAPILYSSVFTFLAEQARLAKPLFDRMGRRRDFDTRDRGGTPNHAKGTASDGE